MSRTIEIAAAADLSAWTDITDVVDRTSIRVGGRAYNGESASCGFDLDDDAATRSWPAHRVVRVIEDATAAPTVMGWCRVVSDSSSRGSRFDGDVRRFDVSLADRNSDVRGIPVYGWSRPEETDVERVLALIDEYLDGSFRASTNLTGTYVRNANTVTLDAKKYDAQQLADVLQSIADEAGKIWFVTADGELFYDIETSTAYAAPISISDAGDDDGETIFAPTFDSDAADREKGELLSGGVAPYGSAGGIVTERRPAVEAANDRWEEVLSVDATHETGATRQLAKQLDARAVEDLTVRCSIDLRADQVDLLKYGQTLSFRAAAAAIMAPKTLRVAELVWEEIGAGLYRAHLELARPTKIRGRNKTGSGASPAPDANAVITVENGGIELGEEIVAAGVFARNIFPDDGLDSGWVGAGIDRIVGSWNGENVPWPTAPCDIGLGAFTKLTVAMLMYVFSIPADATYIGAIGDFAWVQTGDPPGFGHETAGSFNTASPHLGDGYSVSAGAAGSAPYPNNLADALVDVGHFTGSPSGDHFLPRSALPFGADLAFIIAPTFRAKSGLWCDWVGCADACGSISISSEPKIRLATIAAGAYGWIVASPIGVQDGSNRTFTLPGGYSQVRRVWLNDITTGQVGFTATDGSTITLLDRAPKPTDALLAEWYVPK